MLGPKRLLGQVRLVGLVWVGRVINTSQTPFKDFSKTFQTNSRHLPDTLQTPSRHFKDTFQTSSSHPSYYPSQIIHLQALSVNQNQVWIVLLLLLLLLLLLVTLENKVNSNSDQFKFVQFSSKSGFSLTKLDLEQRSVTFNTMHDK